MGTPSSTVPLPLSSRVGGRRAGPVNLPPVTGRNLRWAALAAITGLSCLWGLVALNPSLLSPPMPWIVGVIGYLIAAVMLQLHAPRGIAVLISYVAWVALLTLLLSTGGFSWVALAVAALYGTLAFGSWMLLTWFAATVLDLLRGAPTS